MGNDICYGDIFSAIKLLSSATFLTIILGIATNKIIAILGGTNGIAMIGLYRNLINFVVSVLSMGMTVVVVQRISTTSALETLNEIIKTAFLFLLLQIVIVVILSFFFADVVSAWVFRSYADSSHILEIRVVLLMAVGILIAQAMIALLNGKVNLRAITIINLVSSFSTFILCYPLMKMGNIGLAMIIGSGSFIGACVGIFMVWRTYGLKIRNFTTSMDIFKTFSAVPVSIYLIIHPIVMTTTFLAIQVMVNNIYGVTGLGFYNAVIAIESTSLVLIMSSLRTYLLPTLGQLSNQREKAEFVNKMITILIILMLPFIVGLILGAKYLLLILYSDKFIPATNLVAFQSMAMLIHAFTWCYAYYLNHDARYGTYLMLDTIWSLFLLTGTWYFTSHDFPLIFVVLNYLAGCMIILILYLFVMRRLYGEGMLKTRNIKLGVTGLFLVIISYLLSEKSVVVMQVAYFFFICGYTYYLMKRYYFRERLMGVR